MEICDCRINIWSISLLKFILLMLKSNNLFHEQVLFLLIWYLSSRMLFSWRCIERLTTQSFLWEELLSCIQKGLHLMLTSLPDFLFISWFIIGKFRDFTFYIRFFRYICVFYIVFGLERVINIVKLCFGVKHLFCNSSQLSSML